MTPPKRETNSSDESESESYESCEEISKSRSKKTNSTTGSREKSTLSQSGKRSDESGKRSDESGKRSGDSRKRSGDSRKRSGEFGTKSPCKHICIINPETVPLRFLMPVDITIVTSLKNLPVDVLVVVGTDVPDFLIDEFNKVRCYDRGFDMTLTLFMAESIKLPVIYSPLPKTTEYHDVRVYHDAAVKGFDRVVRSKFLNPALFVTRCSVFPNGDLLSVMGALQSVYVPLQVREENPSQARLIKNLYLLVDCQSKGDCLAEEINAIEPARFTFRDIAMGDPERLTPIQIEDYVYELFKNTPVVMEVVCDPDTLRDFFPLFNSVNQGALFSAKRYAGRIVLIEYVPPCDPRKTLMLVGKGTTFDTGGVSIKYWGLSGMSRDKSGAAAVLGFVKLVSVIKPDDIHCIGAMALVRNTVGEQAYVPDEIVRARSGRRIRFFNTHAEGRLMMSDPLTYMKENIIARHLVDPHLFTIGTMTEHARIYVGNGYPVMLDNSVARAEGHALNMQATGQLFGEPLEISVLRQEDMEFNKGEAQMEDYRQANCCFEDVKMRAHQGVMGFLMQSSGLYEHDLISCLPIKYTHIDIQGSTFNYPYVPASQPIISIAKLHLD